jgi:ectoine hydroxylase-related dioxygenase (phytanoyl-CoA dioxygenase family)
MAQLLREFQEKGFCIVRNAISADLVSKTNDQIDAFLSQNSELLFQHDLLVDRMLHRVVNLHYCITALQNIFCRSMEAASEVVDNYGRATLYTSLFFEAGSEQELHRDTPYFYSGGDGGYMGVWVALDDVDEGNGALLVVEESHKIGEPDLDDLKNRFFPNEEVPVSSTPLFDAYNKELRTIANDLKLKTTPFIAAKGDMIIWNPSTLHGALPHIDKERSRRSFVMHITPQDQPIKQMDYFFNKAKQIEKQEKIYTQVEDRLIAAGSEVNFRHIRSFSVSDLGLF